MDETIGAKGGYNDKRRALKIFLEQKRKLRQIQEEKEIKELEKKVRRQQTVTLIKTLPIAIGGGAIQTLTGKNKEDKQEERSKWRIKEYSADMTTKSRQEEKREKEKEKLKEKEVEVKEIIIIRPDGKKIVVKVPVDADKRILDLPEEIKEPIVLGEKKKESKEEKEKIEADENNKLEEKPEEVENKEEIRIEKVIEHNKKEKKKIDEAEKEEEVNSIEIEKEKTEEEKERLEEKELSFDNLSDSMKEKLNKLKARKIIDEYGKQLKNIRYDLRKLIFDYNVLVQEEENAMTSKELEDILDRLSEVIDRIEELKNRIQIDNLDKYDDNYIYTLIEDYLLEFKDKKVISEIKDSPLYILISEKLDELDKKKDSLKGEVESRKDQLEDKEENFEKLKGKYTNIDKINKELEEFQKNQESLLKEMQYKIDNAVDISERVDVQIQVMNDQSRRLLRMLARSMFFPGARGARGVAATTAAYLYFARQIMNPQAQTVTKKYKVIKVTDYGKDIENSIKSIEDAMGILDKTDKQVDSLISLIKTEFKDYLGVVKECDELLSNLEKVKSDLREKEYEMERVKRAQERELERNNAKVLTRGEYQM